MKRGWITWNPAELPRAAFDSRLAAARHQLAAQDLPALVVYTDIWRSNQGRRFSNFMPYWNRALLVIPREDPPLLLCGLSPRVYPWIRSVTILEEIVPSPNLPQQLVKIASDRGWKKLGVLDLDQLPYDLLPRIEAIGVTLSAGPDEWELGLHRKAAQMAREILADELPHGIGISGHEFSGRLERRLRRAGAEDLVLLLTNGETAPRPPEGALLTDHFSAVLALEYRGHWVKLGRTNVPVAPPAMRVVFECLSGPYPFEAFSHGPLFAMHQEFRSGRLRLFHGDTYYREELL